MDEVLRDVLRQCVEQGMQPPLILCVVSPNGSVMVMRTDGEHPEILAEHTEGAGFSTPINCMVVDRAGAAAYHRAKRCHRLSLGCRTLRALTFCHHLPGRCRAVRDRRKRAEPSRLTVLTSTRRRDS